MVEWLREGCYPHGDDKCSNIISVAVAVDSIIILLSSLSRHAFTCY